MERWWENEIGPFAVWQWVGILVAAIALSWAAQKFMLGRSSGGGSTARPVDQTQDPSAGTMPTGGSVSYAPNGAAGSGGGSTDRGAPTRDTNRMWLSEAAKAVGETGSYGPADVDTALRRYLTGRKLTDEHYRIVDAALRLVGPPPEGAPPIERADDEVPRDDPFAPPEDDEPTASGEDAELAKLEQQVRDYYAQGHASPGQYHPTQSGDEVVARLARQLQSGTRSWADVTRSIDLQHDAAREGVAPDDFGS